MGELIMSLLVLLWNLSQLAFWVWIIYGFASGRLVWVSKEAALMRRLLRKESSP